MEVKKILNYSLSEEENDSVHIEKPQHHSAVSWDNARADILAAALHLVAKNPDILKTVGQLAEGARIHKAAMCGKKGGRNIQPPGALALIEEAINTGKVYFNKR